jgi:ribosomal protein S18 acetylase RimI-like enzyme
MTRVNRIELRRATVEDALLLAQIHVDAWRAAYRGLVPDAFLERFTYELREVGFRQAPAENAEETYVAALDGEAVGILTVGIGRDPDLDICRTGEIWGIYLLPDYWRQGIGRQLATAAERMLRDKGYEEAILWVLADNQSARRFYEAMGFARDGQSKQIDWGTPLTAVRYAKKLTC